MTLGTGHTINQLCIHGLGQGSTFGWHHLQNRSGFIAIDIEQAALGIPGGASPLCAAVEARAQDGTRLAGQVIDTPMLKSRKFFFQFFRQGR